MPIPLYVVDAFTAEPFKGNPAAVCLLEAPRPDAWMQSIAMEMNLSETAFVVPRGAEYSLRWFTPTTEVPLCGHATLASTHVLGEAGRLKEGERARFHTLSGVLEAARRGPRISMDFPSLPVVPAELPPSVAKGLQAKPRTVAHTDKTKETNYLLELESEAAVRELRPDLPSFRAIDWGVIVTARADAGRPYDFVSRYFAGFFGIDEDPVTGAAHCSLAPFWAARLGRNELVGYQASARGGIVRCSLRGDRVGLEGEAVTVFRGELSA